jgi:hypothetical protein
MDKLVIWGNDDHEVRARALATTYSTTARSIDSGPIEEDDLETLVFWGHGYPTEFCDRTPDAFLDLVASWKKLNPKLKELEMLTCNARHKEGGRTDSYTDQVVTKITKKHKNLQFRALPILTTKNAEVCTWSVLQWHGGSATWAYIGGTGTDENLMWAAAHMLEDFMPPRGTYVGYPRAFDAFQAFTGRTAMDAFTVKYAPDANLDPVDFVKDYNKRLKVVRKHCAILTGTLGSLRWAITDIK